jgi:hypothetical protein
MIEHNISNFIEQQFPAIYREEGPFLVEFLKQYYVWLETDVTSPVYQARHHLENHDVDTTVDQFIVYFKEKYLKDVQLNTATNTKRLIKNAIDLYRSRGTENSIRLFFDLIFSSDAEVYYPGEDVFRLSSAEWVIPRYIEVTSTPINRLMVGRQVRGVNSNATAFVEKLVRRKVRNTHLEVFYVSAISGQFETGEIIALSSLGDYALSEFPKMLGSLTTLDITEGGTGFAVGDQVKLDSSTGDQGRAVVQSLEVVSGIVDFELIDGGWGYTSNSVINISDKVLFLSNVVMATTDNTSMYGRLTDIVQPMANVQWYDNTAPFSVGETVYNYYANGDVRGVSKIISADYGSNSTTQYFLLNTLSGNSAPYTPMVYTYYSSANTKNFKVYNAGWTDNTATGTVTGLSSNVSLVVNSSNPTLFSNGDFIYQVSSNNQVFARGQITKVSNATSNTFTIRVSDYDGMFLTNQRLISETTSANATIDSMNMEIGLRDITGSFRSFTGNYIEDTANNSLFNASIVQVPFGNGANVSFDTDLLYPESVELNTDFIRDHIDPGESENDLDAPSYGALLNDANGNTVLDDAFNYDTRTLGTIARLTNKSPGEDYSYPPFAIPEEELIAPMRKADFVIRITAPTGIYQVGEMVTQTATGAQGLVKSANSSEVAVRRLTFGDRWSTGVGNTYLMIGGFTGFTSTVSEVTYDIDGFAGMNAEIETDVISSNSAVLSLLVTDCGFGYKDNQLVQFTSLDRDNSGVALASVKTHGFSQGYYRTSGGFLSSNKYLYDGEYYQDFSYEIRSPITVDRYADMLKHIIHVSGTKAFSAIMKSKMVDVATRVVHSSITQSTT